jgi:hypothetical protein
LYLSGSGVNNSYRRYRHGGGDVLESCFSGHIDSYSNGYDLSVCTELQALKRIMNVGKDAYYFSHDSNARHDFKIKAMRRKYGWLGYAWYWVIVETMRDEADYCLAYNSIVFEALAEELDASAPAIRAFIDDCTDADAIGLFVCDGTRFWSESLMRRMEHYEAVVEQRRQAGIRSGQTRRQKAEDKERVFNGCSTDAEQTLNKTNGRSTDAEQNRTKEIKKRNKIKKEYSDHVFLTDTEYKRLFDRYGKETSEHYIERLSGWKASGKTTTSDYLTLLNWIRRDEQRDAAQSQTKTNEQAALDADLERKRDTARRLATERKQDEEARARRLAKRIGDEGVSL